MGRFGGTFGISAGEFILFLPYAQFGEKFDLEWSEVEVSSMDILIDQRRILFLIIFNVNLLLYSQ